MHRRRMGITEIAPVRGEPCSAYLRRCGSDLCHICLHPWSAHSRQAQAQEWGRLTSFAAPDELVEKVQA